VERLDPRRWIEASVGAYDPRVSWCPLLPVVNYRTTSVGPTFTSNW
jgi:hypothetical protein